MAEQEHISGQGQTPNQIEGTQISPLEKTRSELIAFLTAPEGRIGKKDAFGDLVAIAVWSETELQRGYEATLEESMDFTHPASRAGALHWRINQFPAYKNALMKLHELNPILEEESYRGIPESNKLERQSAYVKMLRNIQRQAFGDESIPPIQQYERVESVINYSPSPDTPSPVENLLNLIEGRVFLPEAGRRVASDKVDAIRSAIAEMRAYGQSLGNSDEQNGQGVTISIQDGYIDPDQSNKTPMFRTRLVAPDSTFRGEEGITVDIDFRVAENERFLLKRAYYHKNDPRQGKGDPNTVSQRGELPSLINSQYEVLRLVIEGYRGLVARDKVDDGGQQVIKGHTFQFKPLP
ncbi:MAG TPA: hypothetical protein VFC02_03710 [Anaerolineales bacterium]|jgi:hypothetical protein|nr:hypothetical protein [Anaerolineales bacterium]